MLLYYIQFSKDCFILYYVRFNSEKENAHLNRSWAGVKRYTKLMADENSLLTDRLEADKPPSLPQSGRGWASVSFTVSKTQAQPLGDRTVLPMAMRFQHSRSFACRVQEHWIIKIPSWKGLREIIHTAYLPQGKTRYLSYSWHVCPTSCWKPLVAQTLHLPWPSMPVLNCAYKLLGSSYCLNYIICAMN